MITMKRRPITPTRMLGQQVEERGWCGEPMRRVAPSHVLAGLIILMLISLCNQKTMAQRIVLQERVMTSGVVVSQKPGLLRMTDENGKTLDLKFQGPDDQAVSLNGAAAIIKFPASIDVRGTLNPAALQDSQFIQFKAQVRRSGRFKPGAVVGRIQLLDAPATVAVTPDTDEDDEGYVECTVVGQILAVKTNRLALQVDRSRYASGSRLAVPIDDSTRVFFQSKDLSQVSPGDEVKSVAYARFSTGDLVIESIDVSASSNAETESAVDPLELKFSKFSDDPSPPRDVRSAHFLLHTDLSDRQAQILLSKLEVMIELVSRYFGQRSRQPIECYVVRDLSQWDDWPIEAAGRAKIQSGEGVTISRGSLKGVTSVVYSCDKHGVVQHEAMHAFCAQTFGSTGPTWYSEGVAEMGQYWKAGELAVNIDPVVADYLSRSQPKKKLLEIVAAGQVTGDSWQAYAWRWALCHLLANNPNYQGQFKRLGIAMMKKLPESFESAYGGVAKEISFEYDQFVKHVANGYRADLCAWQWTKKFTPLRSGRKVKCDVLAAYGWQASGVEIDAGSKYQLLAEGEIRLAEGGSRVTADGDSQGRGRLMGVVFNDYQLGEPFELGANCEFEAPSSGRLYLRVLDDYTALADNGGKLEVTVGQPR